MPVPHKTIEPRITIGHYRKGPFHLPFRLNMQKLLLHSRVSGISGSGKSSHLSHRIASQIALGLPCFVIDPHGELVDDILLLLNQQNYFKRLGEEKDRLLYMDFGRMEQKERYIPFNFFHQESYTMYALADHFVDVCERVWSALAEGAAPSFENVMYYASIVALANKLPLPAIVPILTNKKYRDFLLSRCPDPYVAAFFHDQYEVWTKKDNTLAASTLRRVNLLVRKPLLRYTLGQRDNLLDFPALMNGSNASPPQSVLISLRHLDKRVQKLLGSLICVGMEQAMLFRDPKTSTPYWFFLDEFANFITKDSGVFETFVEQARKFRVPLIFSHQTNHQLVKEANDALLKSVGNIQFEIHFRQSHEDAVYEAGRLYEPDIYRIKHQERGLHGKDLSVEHHPMYVSWQEYLLEKAWGLKKLRKQHAIVKYPRDHLPWFMNPLGIKKIKAVTVKIKQDEERLEEIKRYFEETYTVPFSHVLEEAMPLLQTWEHTPLLTEHGSF